MTAQLDKITFPDLTFLGPADGQRLHRLPVVSVRWLTDPIVPVSPVLMGRNGRPRQPITLPGYGKGVKPANTGKTYPPEPLTNAEALALLAMVPTMNKSGSVNAVGIRNRALLTLLWRTGLRVSEALDLLPHHVDFGAKRVTVLCGKGSKRRTVGIDVGGLAALQPWVLERAMLGIANTAPLFCTIQLPGRGGRLNSKYVRHVLHGYGALAGIPKRVHPHGLRHSLACGLITEGFSLAHVQAQLGHNDMATTCIYLRGLGADEAFERVSERAWPS